MLKILRNRKNSPRAHTMPEASFGPVFVVLPSPTSSSIDHVAVLLPVLVCWSWSLPVAVEERSEEDFKLKLQIT